MAEERCSVEGCNKPIDSKGMCAMHYSRVHRYGRTYRIKTKQGNKCKIKECNKKPYCRNLCQRHYFYWWKYSDPKYYEKTPKMHKIEKKYQEDIKKLLLLEKMRDWINE